MWKASLLLVVVELQLLEYLVAIESGVMDVG